MIETRKFPALPGEAEELANEGMYGKALCQYLEARLPATGIQVPFFCNEDWGWWLEAQRDGFKMGLSIYADPESEGGTGRYWLLPSIQEAKKWSWSKFSKVDVSADVLGVMEIVERLFRNDPEIASVSRHDQIGI